MAGDSDSCASGIDSSAGLRQKGLVVSSLVNSCHPPISRISHANLCRAGTSNLEPSGVHRGNPLMLVTTTMRPFARIGSTPKCATVGINTSGNEHGRMGTQSKAEPGMDSTSDFL